MQKINPSEQITLIWSIIRKHNLDPIIHVSFVPETQKVMVIKYKLWDLCLCLFMYVYIHML